MDLKDFTKKLRIALSIPIIFLLPALFCPSSVFACECAPASIDSALSNSDAVFAGKVSKIEYLDNPEQISPEPRTVVTFDVSQWWKGSDEKQAVLHTVHNTFTCNGYWFKDNEEYLVYASRQSDGTFGTSFCQRTNTLSQAAEDLAKLGKGAPPAERIQPSGKKFMPGNLITEIAVGIIALVIIGAIHKIAASKRKAAKVKIT
ncbi:MAG: hypothetical protein WC745_04600 [Patescibacteria group bacterium]|jgi:hypothetical protein